MCLCGHSAQFLLSLLALCVVLQYKWPRTSREKSCPEGCQLADSWLKAGSLRQCVSGGLGMFYMDTCDTWWESLPWGQSRRTNIFPLLLLLKGPNILPNRCVHDAFIDSCRHHGREAVLFILLVGVCSEDAFHTCRHIPSLAVEEWMLCVEVHTEPTHTPSDDRIYITWTLADRRTLAEAKTYNLAGVVVFMGCVKLIGMAKIIVDT